MGPRATEFVSFEERLRTCFRTEPLSSSLRKVARQGNVYTCGDDDANIYLVETGQIKIGVLSPDGRECLVAIHAAGDIFGELCLAGGARTATATAMKDSLLRQMPCSKFLSRLTQDGLLKDLVRHLTARLGEQQQATTNLLIANSEQRLAATLLHLARKLGKRNPNALRLEEGFSHQELSKMVGTTRSRIGHFLQRFQELGFIERTRGRSLIVKEDPLAQYLDARLPVRQKRKGQMLKSEQTKARAGS